MQHTNPSSDDWVVAHEELSRLARARAVLDWEEAPWLLCAARAKVHRHLGFGSFIEYTERLFGYKPRTTEEKLRVAEALERLPELRENLRTGALSWSAVRELTRVATPDTERVWLDAAQRKTVRQIEQMVSGRERGATPSTPARPELVRHVLTFDVTAETLALFREAIVKLRRDADESLDDDAALLLMARHVLEGPSDDGRASYQIAINRCRDCGRASQLGKGEAFAVGSEVAEMAVCDAQHIGSVDSSARVGGAVAPAAQDVPPATRRHVLRRDQHRCVVPGCKNAIFLDLHHLDPRSEGGSHDPDALVALCGAHHRAEHRGQLIIEGRVSTGLRFRHADGTSYGQLGVPRKADLHARVFSALRNMGFRETEVRRALDEVRAHGPENTELTSLLRAALRVLTPPTGARSARGMAARHQYLRARGVSAHGEPELIRSDERPEPADHARRARDSRPRSWKSG